MIVEFRYDKATSQEFLAGVLQVPAFLTVVLQWGDDPPEDRIVYAPISGNVDVALTTEDPPRLLNVDGIVSDLADWSAVAALLGSELWEVTVGVIERQPAEVETFDIELASLEPFRAAWQELSEAAAAGKLAIRPPNRDEREEGARNVTLILSDPRGRGAVLSGMERFLEDHRKWQESQQHQEQPD